MTTGFLSSSLSTTVFVFGVFLASKLGCVGNSFPSSFPNEPWRDTCRGFGVSFLVSILSLAQKSSEKFSP
jgi:uncharacterized membrane protein required for colicin V production